MIKDDMQELLSPVVEELGYVLWGCEYLAQGKHSLLRIYIDKEEGIGIEDCEKVSRQAGALLDVEGTLTGNYSLEVSSPGIPRPLFHLRQYQRYVGQEVQLKLYSPIAGKRKFTGNIAAVDTNSVILVMGEAKQTFLFSNIVKANLTGE